MFSGRVPSCHVWNDCLVRELRGRDVIELFLITTIM